MSRQITPFFATHQDLSDVLRDAMAVRAIELVDAGLLDHRQLIILSGPGNMRARHIYLVVDRGDRMHMREIPQRRGGEKYKVNLADDFNNVTLNTGGILSEIQMLPGQVGTLSDKSSHLERYNLLSKIIKKRFERIGPYYVGREAAAMLDAGGRLSMTAKSPPEYDLTR